MIERYFPVLVLAFGIDFYFGEPPLFLHPVFYIGKLISFLRKTTENLTPFLRLNGFFLFSAVILVALIFLYFLKSLPENLLTLIFFAILLKTTFSVNLMMSIPENIEKKLFERNLKEARLRVSEIVSRETEDLDERLLTSATIESIAENLTDSVVAPIFYYLFFGINGAFLYRCVNTMDSVIGYKNLKIGFFAAKFDDLLNFIPSRIGAFLMLFSAVILKENFQNGFKVFLRDRGNTESPNVGQVISVM
ncbi:MAG: adenosylcobinamide-phosphate synthase CbiB, partial [Candidatus Methanofastidiosia archaeon]